MKSTRIERAFKHIFDAHDDEILCSECFEYLDEYVERELAGEPVAREMGALKDHLDHCKVCAQEYETLRDWARLEAEGRAPSLGDLKNSL